MRLEEIRKNPAIMQELRFDLTPEKLAIPKEATFDPKNAGFYFCIYVRDSKACLALLHYLPDGTATHECIAGQPPGDLIRDALEGIDTPSGYYAINKPIEKLLRTGLYGADKVRSPRSKAKVRQLLDRLMELLHHAHGGNYYGRFNEIARERGRKVESSHFSKMDTVSIQLLIETIEAKQERNAKAVTHVKGVISVLEQPCFAVESVVDEKAREYQISRLKEAAALLEEGL